ncbi:MAG: restriction endonuclease subunit S [Desulfuromonadales bacterium]|nr:restriction endonuclease subunit S [Desulfuromonadales bacterium]
MNRNVPTHWKMMKFCEVAEVVTGSTPSTIRDDYFGGEIPFVTPTELKGGVPVTKTPVTLTELGAKQVRVIPENSIMVCCIGSLGKIGIAGTRLATNQQINSVVFDEKIVSPRYGFHYCQTLKPLLIHLAPSTTVPIINKGRFQELQIPFPPLPEQKRIAAILDKADSIRRKRQEAVRLAEELLSSTFLDMFGDPETNPKGVKIVQLSEITTRITDGVHQKPNYTSTGVPFISVKDITTGALKFDNCKFVSLEDHQMFTKRCKAEQFDILYTKVGATYGRPAIVDTDQEFSLYVSVCLIKPDRKLVDSNYLKAVLGTKAIKRQADKRIKGIGVPDLHLDQIQQILIPLPAMEEQCEFACRVAAVEKLKTSQNEALVELNTLFNSLLQRAFKGKQLNLTRIA